MTDLTGKFNSLQTQLALQHGELMAALAGLGDLATNVAALNTTLQTLSDNNTAYYDASLEVLAIIANNVDLMLINNSLNAQRILALMLATSCPCDDSGLLPPPLITDPTTAENIEKCARIQYFVDLWFSWVLNVAAYMQSGSISSFQLNNLLQLSLVDVDITTGELSTGMPQYIRDTIVSRITSSTYTPIQLSHMLIDANTPEVKEAMRQALYSADNASAGADALNSAIDTLTIDDAIVGLFKALFYSAFYNDIYSAVPIVDTSAYDGTLCAGADCDTLHSGSYSGSGSILTTESFSGWEEYRVRLTTTAGSALAHIYIDGIEVHTWSAPHDETIATSGTVHIELTGASASAGTLTLEGCPSQWGGS